MDDLEVRVQELEKENEYLKSLLDQAGIAHDFQTYLKRLEIVAEPETVDKAQGSDVVAGSGDQGARILPCIISTKHAQYFFLFFRGREDVYALRAVNKKTGRAGYYPQCHNFWRRGVCPKADRQKVQCKDCENRAWIKLKSEQIEAHLRGDRPDGSDVIGIYPLFPDGTCRFLVFDFDNHGTGADAKDGVNEDDRWVEEVNALQEICRRNDIPFLAERSRSGRGAHVWIFFGEPIEAGTARRFGFALLEKGAESVNLKSFRFYDRMLPAQDTLPDGGLGNLIALPLQGQALKNGNSAFVDEKWNAFPDQWNALLQTKRLSKRDIEFRLKEWSYPLVEKGQSETDNAKDVKPWERQREFHREDVTGSMHIVLSNQIYIDASNIKPRLQNQIRRMAAISNPIFFKNNAIGFSNYKNSRFIYLGEDDSGYVCIPRGLFEQLKEKCEKAGIPCRIEDQRSNGIPVKAVFTGELRENQIKAASRMMDYDCGILSAATAFGKTVVCSNLIAQRKTSTLILLESSALIEQWEKALNEFLSIDEELPTYQTPSGRTKTRKSLIGVIHGAKDTSTGIIDIAMVGSLCKKGEYHPRLRSYGMCIVDECHHAAADTMRNVLQEINAQYVYGVTATPFRGDGLEKINEMLLGPIRFQFTAKEKAAEQGIVHVVVPRFTRAVCPYGREKLHVNDAYEILRDSEVRNEQITADIQGCVENGRTPVVLTKYTDHAALLYERVKGLADRVFLLVGTKSKKEQHAIREEMDAVRPDESMVLIATGQLIGEGFDYPRLDTLFIAMPVSWKGIVEQYAGRLNRDYPGKKRVEIYDYIDAHIPVFDQMYAKRLKAYKRIGYHLLTEDNSGKQERNAIFDCDTYLNAYEQDLKEATKSIVISSPTLGRNKVVRLLKIIQDRQERGVKAVIVTWHPDAYMYGRDEHRHELLDMLREAGGIIHLARENCEHFAIIDGEIVWYGSMNLLSKEDVEDNLMRVVSADIAAELMEMTFGKERELIEIGL